MTVLEGASSRLSIKHKDAFYTRFYRGKKQVIELVNIVCGGTIIAADVDLQHAEEIVKRFNDSKERESKNV